MNDLVQRPGVKGLLEAYGVLLEQAGLLEEFDARFAAFPVGAAVDVPNAQLFVGRGGRFDEFGLGFGQQPQSIFFHRRRAFFGVAMGSENRLEHGFNRRAVFLHVIGAGEVHRANQLRKRFGVGDQDVKLPGFGCQDIQHVADLGRRRIQLAAHQRFGAHVRAGNDHPVGRDLVVLRHPFDQRFGHGDRRVVADAFAVQLFDIFDGHRRDELPFVAHLLGDDPNIHAALDGFYHGDAGGGAHVGFAGNDRLNGQVGSRKEGRHDFDSLFLELLPGEQRGNIAHVRRRGIGEADFLLRLRFAAPEKTNDEDQKHQ